jgi:hypothetical protein
VPVETVGKQVVLSRKMRVKRRSSDIRSFCDVVDLDVLVTALQREIRERSRQSFAGPSNTPVTARFALLHSGR